MNSRFLAAKTRRWACATALVGVLLPAVGVTWAADLRGPHEAPVPFGGDAPAADPGTYPDAAGFAARRAALLRAMAGVDLGQWRRGYFKGGDPGKYLPLHVMARLAIDPADPDALRYINDDRAPTQHFHFVMVNWARLVPMFADALEAKTLERFTEGVRRSGDYIRTDGKGTENHIVMALAAGVVLPDYLDTDTMSRLPVADAQARAKAWLRDYVRTLYHFGQSEWDSSTYLLFDINSMLNIYDFSKDPECRLLARAALDWYVTLYALKYADGTHAGPKERGWTDGPMHAITDEAGWLWFGSTHQPSDAELAKARFAAHAALSAYRPNAVITRLARRDLPGLPFVARSTKPNYWMGLNSAPGIPVANISQETLRVGRRYTLGTLWFGEDFCTQLTRHQLVVANDDGTTYTLTGSQPGTYAGSNEFEPGVQKLNVRYGAGQGTRIVRPDHTIDPVTAAVYTQYAQMDGTVICMAEIPAGDPLPFTYYTTPVPPTRVGDWYVMDLGGALAAVHPLSDSVEAVAEADPSFKRPILKFPGMRTGWVLHVVDPGEVGGPDGFRAWLTEQTIDRGEFQRNVTVRVRSTGGRLVQMTYVRGGGHARTLVDGRPVTFADWPQCDSPFVRLSDGVLSVNDGQRGFSIDFRGDRPVYRDAPPPTP